MPATGTANPSSKLNPEQVKEIRLRVYLADQARELASQHSRHALAKEFGVSYNTIRDICEYDTWRHVEDTHHRGELKWEIA
jgi:transposase